MTRKLSSLTMACLLMVAGRLAAQGAPNTVSAPDTPPPFSLGIAFTLIHECAADEAWSPAAPTVTFLRSGGPADRAGVMVGDVLSEFAGIPIEMPDDLFRGLAAAEEGERYDLVVQRGSTRLTLPLRFQAADAATAPAAAAPSPPDGQPLAGAAPAPQSRMPYEILPPPPDAEPLLARLSREDTAVWTDAGVLTILRRDPHGDVSVTGGTFEEPMSRIPGSDAWVLSVRVENPDELFFSYAFTSSEPANRREEIGRFRGPDAPPLPIVSAGLQGRLIETSIASRHLNAERGLTVYIPPNVTARDLPAVFMADGQSVSRFAGVLEPLIEAGRVRPTAIVGIHAGMYAGEAGAPYDSAHDRRAQEYLPFGGSDAFDAHMAFVIEEVLPWATSAYGISDERADRMIFGFSNGGVFALSAALQHPDVFAYAMPLSTGWTPPERPEPNGSLPRFFFAAGNLEPSFAQTTCTNHQLVRALEGESSFATYASGHDMLMWQIAFARGIHVAGDTSSSTRRFGFE